MTMAVASTRFAVTSTSAETNLSRNGAALSSFAVPVTQSSMSCTFSESFSVKRSGLNAAIVARAAELGEVATEEQQGTKLYVGNLPWTCDSAQLAEICGDISSVEAVDVVYDQQSGRSRGFAFVTMSTNEGAQSVIDRLDGSDFGGRPLKVSFPQPRENRDNKPRFGNNERGDRRSDRPPRQGSDRVLDNTNKMFIGNLSWSCDADALVQVFSEYGSVVDAKVVYDRDTGKSRGFGFVTMSAASEVSNAVQNLDGAEFEGREMRVSEAGERPSPPRY